MAKGVILIDDDLTQEKIFEHCINKSGDLWQFHYFKDDKGLIEFVSKLGLYFNKLIIFCDYYLPAMTGIQLLEKIIRLQVTQEIKVKLFLISSEFEQEQIDFGQQNDVTLLKKPIQNKDIQQILHQN